MYHRDHHLLNQVVTKKWQQEVCTFYKNKKIPSFTTVDQLYEKFTQC